MLFTKQGHRCGKKIYARVNIRSTLQNILSGRCVVEFPEFHVVLFSDLESYETDDDDAERDILSNTTLERTEIEGAGIHPRKAHGETEKRNAPIKAVV